MQINKELQKYIEKFIFPSYKKNDIGHNLDHIMYVIDRSIKFADTIDDINYDMVYTIAAYHDIGHYIDDKNHEKISAEILQNDDNLKKFFTDEQIKIMSEAVYDHRASMEGNPRSIYGQIVSSADRETRIDSQLQRMYEYRIEHNHIDSFEDIIEDIRLYTINKFGKKGYATDKMFFEDKEYEKFLQDMSSLTENKDEFKKRFIKANELNNKLKLTFSEIKRHNPKLSLDDIIYLVYNNVKDENSFSLDEFKKEIARELLLDDEDIKNRDKKMLYILKQVLRMHEGKKFKLIDANGKTYLSDTPGHLGGHKKLKIYGRLDCPSANRWVEKGKYANYRVFFADEETAIKAGYRPCGVCMPKEYKEWKNNQKTKKLSK